MGAAGPCPGVHVGLPGSSRPGDLLAHRQQRDPGKRSGHAVRRSPPLRWRGGPRRRRARVAPHQAGRPVRHRHDRPDPRTPPQWSGPACGRGPGPVQEGPYKTWLSQRDQEWRGRVEVVAMDGFTGFKSAAGEELPLARAVMDPFHAVSLAASKLDECRRRIQRAITGRRGRAGDPLYRARRTLHTGADLLTDAQARRLEALFADDRHAVVQAAWGVYQRLIQAYRAEEAGLGKYLMQRLIDSLRQAVPEGLEEIQTLARTLTERAADILAYFDHPRTSNGPTEAINGRLEHLRGIALGFRNLTHYTIRSLIHTGRLKDHLTTTT